MALNPSPRLYPSQVVRLSLLRQGADSSSLLCYLNHGCRFASAIPIMITGVMIAVNIATVMIVFVISLLYQIVRVLSTAFSKVFQFTCGQWEDAREELGSRFVGAL